VKKDNRTTTTTMRLSKDLVKAMDKEVRKRGVASRTQLFEQTMRKALGLPTADQIDPPMDEPPSVFS